MAIIDVERERRAQQAICTYLGIDPRDVKDGSIVIERDMDGSRVTWECHRALTAEEALELIDVGRQAWATG